MPRNTSSEVCWRLMGALYRAADGDALGCRWCCTLGHAHAALQRVCVANLMAQIGKILGNAPPSPYSPSGGKRRGGPSSLEHLDLQVSTACIAASTAPQLRAKDSAPTIWLHLCASQALQQQAQQQAQQHAQMQDFNMAAASIYMHAHT